MKKIVSFLLIFILLAISVSAAGNSTAGYTWLNKTVKWKTDTTDKIAWATLALTDAGYNVNESYLKAREKRNNFDNGDIKNTALGILALDILGYDVTNETNWLEKAQKVSYPGTGQWMLQIKSDVNGSCTIKYGSPQQSKQIEITGEKIFCSRQVADYMVDITLCTGASLKDSYYIDCSNIGQPLVSLIYKDSSGYYLLQDERTSAFTLYLNNKCFGKKDSSSVCDYDATQFASWVMKQYGKRVYTENYLRLNSRTVSRQRVIDNSFLYLATKNSRYSDWLLQNQNNLSGSWDFDPYATSLAVLALRSGQGGGSAVDSAAKWLALKQDPNGYWGDRDFITTSTVLYSSFGNGYKKQQQGETRGCNNDGICQPSRGENETNCNDCSGTLPICGNNKTEGTEDCDAVYDSRGILINGSDTKCPKKCDTVTCKCITVSGCVDNSTCNTNEYCDIPTATCLPILSGNQTVTECTTNADCDFGEYCDSLTNECAINESGVGTECTTNADCLKYGNDYECNSVTNKCEIKGVSGCSKSKGDNCEIDSDCATGEYCDAQSCSCTSESVPGGKKGGFPWWILTLIFIIVIGVGLFLAYNKYKKQKGGPGKRPTFDDFLKTREQGKRPLIQTPFKESEEEKKLDLSIKKAEDIFKEK